MSNGLKVLVHVRERFSFYENVKEAWESMGREEFLKDIRNYAKNELESYLDEEIGYFVDGDPDKDWIAGVEDNERLRKEVEEWNGSCIQRAVSTLKHLEELKKEHGLAELSDLVMLYETGGGEFNDRYESLRYYLKQAIVELEGNFIYGNYRMVLDSAEYGRSFSTRIKKETLEDIRKNPENYAIIYLYYK